MICNNIGPTDRVMRIVFGLALIGLGFFVGGTLGVAISVFGLVPLATGSLGYCPVYSLFKINGCRPKTPKHV